MTAQYSEAGKRPASYTFILSRDFPRIWADRSDVIVISSIVLALVLFLTGNFLKASAPGSINAPTGIDADVFSTAYWILGSVLCFAVMALWLTLKFQSIRIEEAPLLSKVSPFIRFSVYVVLLCGPFALFYAELSQELYAVHRSVGASYYGFNLEFFYSPDPWLSWITLAGMMAVLVFASSTHKFGISPAVGGLIVTLLWYAVFATVGGTSLSLLLDRPSDVILGYVYGGFLVTLILLAGLVPGKSAWVHVCFVAPALYTATFGPWILILSLVSDFDMPRFSGIYSSVAALVALVLVDGIILALLERKFRR